ncbi:hypothetical protein P22_1061 [Propionispora sp. 2/2-37]|uniref:S-layer homology domain-containing protein n=1 Tax=Propionispora sp. 2/2-37 TaxID=1677858 RepID=UPI0006C43CC4|nr:S-layer homology domain-containing protein [Propionispora sp. 2/2-37]CUH94992.1 hypothetical protein P22_1061 [Propionispora sp. 2/2-37]
MKARRKFLAVTLVFSIFSFSGIAFAATNPFSSVPKDHWAYPAVEKLVHEGLIDGYGDEDFRGEKAITRYEMAELVAKAMSNEEKADAEDKAALEKLANEFSDELKNLGVRLTNVENNMSSFKWYGDARFRYQKNYNNDIRDDSKYGNSKRIQQRVRLGFYGTPAENVSVIGRVKMENTTNQDTGWGEYHNAQGQHNSAYLDLLGLNWNHDNLNVAAGRIAVSLGQGVIWWDNPVDGIYATYDLGKAQISAGWGDLTAENWRDYSMNAFLANISVPVNDRTTATLAYLKTSNSDNTVNLNRDDYGNGTWKAPFMLKQYAYGFKTQLSDKLNLLAEGVTNRAAGLPDNAQKNGWWSRLTWGNQQWNKANTYNVYLEYLKFGNWAIDSTGWGHILNISGGDGLGNDGQKGWGVGVSYMLAANTNLEINYYKLKPYDSGRAGFDSYKPSYNASLSFSF